MDITVIGSTDISKTNP